MEVSLQFAVLIPVVVGVVQAFKKAGLGSRWAAVVSILLGILGAGALTGFSISGDVVLQGVVVGLSAAGLFSGVKATVS